MRRKIIDDYRIQCLNYLFDINFIFYDPSRMFQLPQFVWTLRSSVWDVFNNFLHVDATDRSKITSDQKRLFIAVSICPLSFLANTPFNLINNMEDIVVFLHIRKGLFIYFKMKKFKIRPTVPKSHEWKMIWSMVVLIFQTVNKYKIFR